LFLFVHFLFVCLSVFGVFSVFYLSDICRPTALYLLFANKGAHITFIRLLAWLMRIV